MNRHGRPSQLTHLRSAFERFAFPVGALLLMATSAARIQPTESIVLTCVVVGVVVLGLPHGALDPFIAKRMWSQHPQFTQVRFWLLYAAIATICAAFWLIAANTALILFLLISAYHFGSDWRDRGTQWSRLAYGTCIVTLPALAHPQTVSRIYSALGATVAPIIVTTSRVVAVLAVVLASASLWRQLRSRRQDAIELAFIVLGSLFIQPLLFFVSYFCLLHSPRHLLETARRVNLTGIVPIARGVVPALVGALALGALLWHFLPSHQSGDKTLQIVFIGLAAITVPHMLLSEADKRSTVSE